MSSRAPARLVELEPGRWHCAVAGHVVDAVLAAGHWHCHADQNAAPFAIVLTLDDAEDAIEEWLAS